MNKCDNKNFKTMAHKAYTSKVSNGFKPFIEEGIEKIYRMCL